MPVPADQPYIEDWANPRDVKQTPIGDDQVIFELTAKARHGSYDTPRRERPLVTIGNPDRLKVRVEDDTLIIHSEHELLLTMKSSNIVHIRSRRLDEVE